jgi:hypothetical protein
MNHLDELPTRLSAQMRDRTAADVAPPDLLERVQTGLARRRRRRAGGLALVATVGVGVAFALPEQDAGKPDRLAGAQGPAVELVLQTTRGGSVAVRVDQSDAPRRAETVELPAYLRNDGPTDVTLLALTVDGTALTGAVEGRVLVPGGRQPVTLSRDVDCDEPEQLPAELNLRAVTAGGATVVLPLPEHVLALYRNSQACSEDRLAADAAERAAAEQAAREAAQAETAGEPAAP